MDLPRNFAELQKQEGVAVADDIRRGTAQRAGFQNSGMSRNNRLIERHGYDSGTKVALMTKYRFWEKEHGIYGASSKTDLITGPIIYPSGNARDAGGTKPRDPAVSDRPGVFLACYTWGQDARRLGAMPATEREDLAIRQASQVHPELRDGA